MTGEAYARQPVGKVINRGEPLIVAEKTLTAEAKAGHLLAIDGNDYRAKKSDGTKMPAGWLSYEHTDLKFRPVDLDGTFAAGDVVAVVAGGGFEVYAFVTGKAETGSAIALGALLYDNGDGTLTASAPEDSLPVARALESMTVAAAVTARIAVRSLI